MLPSFQRISDHTEWPSNSEKPYFATTLVADWDAMDNNAADVRRETTTDSLDTLAQWPVLRRQLADDPSAVKLFDKEVATQTGVELQRLEPVSQRLRELRGLKKIPAVQPVFNTKWWERPVRMLQLLTGLLAELNEEQGKKLLAQTEAKFHTVIHPVAFYHALHAASRRFKLVWLEKAALDHLEAAGYLRGRLVDLETKSTARLGVQRGKLTFLKVHASAYSSVLTLRPGVLVVFPARGSAGCWVEQEGPFNATFRVDFLPAE